MDRKLPVASLLSLTIAALLAGCGGGGNDSEDTPTPATKSLEVRAVDGYLKGAQVWLDRNGDNLLTVGEPSAITDGTGKASLDVSNVPDPAQYRVLVQAIAKQTTDVGDGTGTPKPVAKTFTMAAPAGVSTVTPLTTLVAQQMAANSGMTQEKAAQEVATQLGLGADKAGDLLKDFIAEKNTTGQIYALNIVAALPEALDDDKADALLTQGAAIGKALDDYLAQNPLDDDTQPDDIKVVIGDDGTVDDVIKDSDGDGEDDDDIPPVTSDTLASFLSNASNWYMGSGDEGDADFRIEEWKNLGSGKASWSAKYQLRGTTAYALEPNESETMYQLTEKGWVQTSERADIQYVANSDGTVSLTDIAHLGTFTGSCSDLSGKSQASEVAWEAKSAQVVNASATFSSGAYGCRASYSSGGYYSDNEAETLHGYTHASSNVATSFSDLFVTTAPVAGDDTSFTTWLWWDAPQTYYRLVLIGDPAQSDSGKAQLWSNDGVTLLKEVTSAGWKKVVVHGQSLILLDSAISSYASRIDAGLALLQGQVVRIKSDHAESSLLLNKTAYDDLMKGRTLVTDSDDSDGDGVADTNDAFPNDASEWSDTDGDGVGDNGDAFPNDPTKWQAETGFASTYPTMNLRGTINNWGVTPMTLVADHLWSVTVTLTATDAFKFDVAGDWSTNFGDANHDGTAEVNTADIVVAAAGTYVVTFNDETKQYTLQAEGGASTEEAAAAFVSLINSDEIVYSVYQEHDALGLTRVDGNSYQGYQLDYSQSVGSFVPTDAGTFTLSVDANNQVTMFDAGSGTTSTIICQQVQALAGVKIQDLLAPITSVDSLAAMQQAFGNAVFSDGAKAYINQHTDSEGSSTQIVLNDVAYQDLLAIIGNPA